MREGYWIVATTGEYQLITDHGLWLTNPQQALALGLSEEAVQAIQKIRWDFNGPGRRQILQVAMDNGLIRSRGHGPAEVTFEFTIDTEAAIRAVIPFMQATLGPASVPKFNNLRTGESLAFNYGSAKKVIEVGDISFLRPVWQRPTQTLPVKRPFVLLSDFEGVQGWTCWELPGDLNSEGMLAVLRRHAAQGCGWLALAEGRTWKLKPNAPPLASLADLNPELADWACPDCGWPSRRRGDCQCGNLATCRVCSLPIFWPRPGRDHLDLHGNSLYVTVHAASAHRCVYWPSVTVLPFDDLTRRGQ